MEKPLDQEEWPYEKCHRCVIPYHQCYEQCRGNVLNIETGKVEKQYPRVIRPAKVSSKRSPSVSPEAKVDEDEGVKDYEIADDQLQMSIED